MLWQDDKARGKLCLHHWGQAYNDWALVCLYSTAVHNLLLQSKSGLDGGPLHAILMQHAWNHKKSLAVSAARPGTNACNWNPGLSSLQALKVTHSHHWPMHQLSNHAYLLLTACQAGCSLHRAGSLLQAPGGIQGQEWG